MHEAAYCTVTSYVIPTETGSNKKSVKNDEFKDSLSPQFSSNLHFFGSWFVVVQYMIRILQKKQQKLINSFLYIFLYVYFANKQVTTTTNISLGLHLALHLKQIIKLAAIFKDGIHTLNI